MATTVQAATFVDEVRRMFESQAARITALEAQRPLENVVERSNAAYAVNCRNAILLANQRSSKILKETSFTGGKAVNIALKTLLVVAAKQAATKKFATALAKELAKNVTKEIAEQAAKKASEKAAQKFLKFVPIIGAVMGVGLAIGRGIKGDHWTLIVGELASGAASCFGPIGAGFSLAIDGALLAVDVHSAYKIIDSQPAVPTYNISINNLVEAYGCLGIEFVEDEAEPDEDTVKRCYRAVSLQYHPDRAMGQSAEVQTRFSNFMRIINVSKDFIKQRHPEWTNL